LIDDGAVPAGVRAAAYLAAPGTTPVLTAEIHAQVPASSRRNVDTVRRHATPLPPFLLGVQVHAGKRVRSTAA